MESWEPAIIHTEKIDKYSLALDRLYLSSNLNKDIKFNAKSFILLRTDIMYTGVCCA